MGKSTWFLGYLAEFAEDVCTRVPVLMGLRRNPAVVLLGPRQVGKTTLARTLLLPKTRRVLYFDLEAAEDCAKFAEPLAAAAQ